jgi:hypothetical protein
MNATKERRRSDGKANGLLRKDLNEEQLLVLAELERFGWELKFIRRPMFQQPVPVVFDADRRQFAVLTSDGTLDENPVFDIRR